MKAIAITELTHNPFDKTRWVSGLRENFTSRSYGEGLETDRTAPRQSLTRQVLHRTLKSGCRIEQRQLAQADRLEACFAIDLVVAWRIYHLSKLGPRGPTSPVQRIFR